MTEEKNKGGAPRGNQNRMIGDKPASTQIQLRITPEKKQAYQAAAESQGLPLTRWAIKVLDDAEQQQKKKK